MDDLRKDARRLLRTTAGLANREWHPPHQGSDNTCPCCKSELPLFRQESAWTHAARLQGLLTMLAAPKNEIPRRLSILLPPDLYRFLAEEARKHPEGSKNAVVKDTLRELRKRRDTECGGK